MTDQETSERELADTRARLREAEETLRALQSGEVDALVVEGADGPRVYTLRSADHPYRLLVEEMHEGAVTLSAGGTIVYANRRFAELVGVSLEQVISRPFLDFVVPERCPDIEEFLGSLPGQRECFLRATTSDVPVTFSASPVLIDEVRYIGVIVTDLTEQKRRDMMLETEKLARLFLEESNKAKDEFLLTVSHELRTPLTAILGWASMLRTYELDAEMQKVAFESIEKAARAQMELIEDILDVSRIVTGKVRLKIENVDLARVLDDSVAAVANSAASKHIRITKVIEPPLLAVRADATRLQQVFWNLLTNALKFTPEGGMVEIRAHPEGTSVVISVSDTGCGISKEFLPRIFDRFTQEDSSATRSHGGLGIGLAVARDLIRLQGGTIDATSEGTGRGTTVTVTVPAFGNVALADRDHAIGSAANRPLAGLSILAVDDEPITRDWLVRTLEYFGAHVVSAANVNDALAAFERDHTDLVLSDLAMPVEDGLSLIRKLRIREDAKSTPAIALTAYGHPEDRERILSAGFDDYLRKPIDAGDLVKAIHAIAAAHKRG